MITLITGGPGMGKTALAVALLLDEYKGRPIFSNVRGLLLEHSPLPKLDEWTREVFNDQGTSEHEFTFPPGAVVVIDECQQFFRPRATGSKVPPYVSAFETHRHKGIDFVLITQGSRLIDTNLRSLVKGGRHIFLKSSYVGRYRYEKSEVINEDDKTAVALASRRRYTLPRHAFAKYKSSELHTKPARPALPLAAFAVVGAVGVAVFLAWKVTGRISEAVAGDPVSDELHEINAAPGAPDAERPGAPGVAMVQPLRMIEALTPLDDHDPLSAPLYADHRPEVVPPQVIGCIASRSACSCYSQQSTPIWLPDEQCRLRASGRYFDPYLPDSSSGKLTSDVANLESEEPPG